MKSEQGFTLLELLFTVLIVAVLAGLAAPSFNRLILINKVQSETQGLYIDIAFARSEAVSRNKFISICASVDGLTCNGSNRWSDGWIVFEDDGAGGVADDFADTAKQSGEKLLRVTQQMENLTIDAIDAGGAGVQGIMFGPRGYIASMRRFSNDNSSVKTTLKVCGPGGDSGVARAIWMQVTGRSELSQDTDGSGIHEDAAGVDLSC
ncbi:MAG: GspH/FimT family pseudopilin [Cellvibrionaceae bacterium]|nr:GspH/FimT family pseudopilin [Cellvibrionaceae bacterium]